MPIVSLRDRRYILGFLPAILVLLGSVITAYKIDILGYNLSAVAPAESYFLETVIEFTGHGSPVAIDLALPLDLPGQKIVDESYTSKDLSFTITNENGNRTARWRSSDISGKRTIGYNATIITKSQRYIIDSTLPTWQKLPASIRRYLLSDSMIQSNDPEIVKLSERLGLDVNQPILKNIRLIYDFATDSLNYVKYSGTTDALTAYRLNEASCGGKSRLMVALARQLGIPGRLVGGKILQSGRSTATHIWVELNIHGQWVPFCPTNRYFAEIPSRYMTLYHGEEPAITHTKDINFKYYFSLKKRLIAASSIANQVASGHNDAFNIWGIFKRAAMSIELLKIIIMLPFGVLVVVIFRNLVGLQTFGTFVPALLAIGFRDTGLANGLILFAAVIVIGTLIRSILAKFQILRTPRLAIIITIIISFLLVTTALSVSFGLMNAAKVALFPIVILTLSVERFSIAVEEDSLIDAIRISIFTMIVASAAFWIMSNRTLQSIMLVFPEMILLLLALYIYMGRYSGLRLTELLRFRHLLIRP